MITERLVPADHVVFTDLDGIEAVLVDLKTKQYFTLNETASLVWRQASAGAHLTAIASEINGHYDVTLDHAVSSVRTILERFIALGLLRAELAAPAQIREPA